MTTHSRIKFPRVFRLFILIITAFCLMVLNHAQELPNVIVILADDQGWGDLSLHGNRNIQTPQIDSIAINGSQFEQFIVCPLCAPTRAEFLTGRYHFRGGVTGVDRGRERLNLDEMTIADVFKTAGYGTACFGKWHNGAQYPYHPNGRGFDEFYGFCAGHWGDYFSPTLEHNGQIVKGNGYITDDLTDRAIEFMTSKHSEKTPFFVYLALNTPHEPMQVPDEYWNKFKDLKLVMPHRYDAIENVDFTRAALAMSANIDWNVGRILQQIEGLNIAKDTIVVYFSDNGPHSFRWNNSFKGRKASIDEGGVRAPCFVKWPGRIAAGNHVRGLSASFDLLPTLTELVGIPLHPKKTLDGKSFANVLLGEEEMVDPERMIFSDGSMSKPAKERIISGRSGGPQIQSEVPDQKHVGSQKRGPAISVRTQRYRLDGNHSLYAMDTDPQQLTDIAEQQPEMANHLVRAVVQWRTIMAEEGRQPIRPFSIGHPDFPYFQLTAGDAIASGNLTRSSRYPNCTYYTNWKDESDFLSWPVEVLEEGVFDVRLYYSCAESDLGSDLRLSYADSSIESKIETAWDPPLKGMEHDRFPRKVSYIKDFHFLSLGKIKLSRGVADLKLQATNIPGQSALDFGFLHLERVSNEHAESYPRSDCSD